MNILHREQEKDGACHHMKKEGILQLLFHRQLRLVNCSYLNFHGILLKVPWSNITFKLMYKIKLFKISLKVW